MLTKGTMQKFGITNVDKRNNAKNSKTPMSMYTNVNTRNNAQIGKH